MPQKHEAAGHHAAAAAHHEAAKRHHRAASVHYRVGKDHAHAAHQSLVAHGHALHALDRGYEASKLYATPPGLALPPHREAAGGVLNAPDGATQITAAARDVGSHHEVAAELHDNASRQHIRALEHLDRKDHGQAAYDAQLAHGYAQRSIYHGDEAAKHHSEHYGATPSAEIV